MVLNAMRASFNRIPERSPEPSCDGSNTRPSRTCSPSLFNTHADGARSSPATTNSGWPKRSDTPIENAKSGCGAFPCTYIIVQPYFVIVSRILRSASVAAKQFLRLGCTMDGILICSRSNGPSQHLRMSASWRPSRGYQRRRLGEMHHHELRGFVYVARDFQRILLAHPCGSERNNHI